MDSERVSKEQGAQRPYESPPPGRRAERSVPPERVGLDFTEPGWVRSRDQVVWLQGLAGNQAVQRALAARRGVVPSASVDVDQPTLVQRQESKFVKGLRYIGKGAGAVLGVVASPLVGLLAGGKAGYKRFRGKGKAAAVAGAIGGAVAGMVLAPLAQALLLLISPAAAVYGAVKGAGYASGKGPARKVGGGVGGFLVGVLGAFSVGAVAGWGLIDYLFPPKATRATFDRVSALAVQYGLDFQIPDEGRTPWLEEELRAIEDALRVYDVVLSGAASPRAVGLALEQERRPWTLEGRSLRKVPYHSGFWDATNAYAGPRSGVSVCGDHIARAAVGPVFGRRMMAGILVHELGHALLSHEVRPFQAEVERQLQQRNHNLHNFWDIPADKDADIRRRSDAAEYPITAYGGKNPEEDMCETARFYFQSPATNAALRQRCPARFAAFTRVARENLQQFEAAGEDEGGAGEIGFTSAAGDRQRLEVTAGGLADLGMAIDEAQANIERVLGDLDAIQPEFSALDKRSKGEGDVLSMPERLRLQQLSRDVQDLRRQVGPARGRLEELRARAVRLQGYLASGQLPAGLASAEPDRDEALYTPAGSGLQLKRAAQSLPF